MKNINKNYEKFTNNFFYIEKEKTEEENFSKTSRF